MFRNMDIHESSWDSLPGAALELVWNSNGQAYPYILMGLKPAPELPRFRLVCKAWLLASSACSASEMHAKNYMILQVLMFAFQLNP